MKKSRQQIIDEMLKYYGLDTKVLIENFKPNRFMGYSNRMQRIKNLGRLMEHKSNFKFKQRTAKDTTFAEYVFDSDTIILNNSAITDDYDFYMTILHEIAHAIDSRDMGQSQFKKAYFLEEDIHTAQGLNGYDMNKYEISAEAFATSELNRWMV